ncbi:MAG: HIT family protein [Saprospiraceae bacterium]|nr:HIT family protein [Saprospiraceae bacterium]
MATIFTKIISGEIPCHKVAETENYLAFLDIRPLAKGHTLCIPKKENDFIFDLADDDLTGLILFAKKVAKAINNEVTSKRIGLTVIGTEVPHTHIHLVPFHQESQMCFASPRVEMTHEEMAELAAKLQAAFNAL